MGRAKTNAQRRGSSGPAPTGADTGRYPAEVTQRDGAENTRAGTVTRFSTDQYGPGESVREKDSAY